MRRFTVLFTTTILAVSCFCMIGCKQEITYQKSDIETMNEIIEGSEPFYVLLVGNDTRAGTVDDTGENYPYSDTMMLAYVEPSKYKVSLVSIPRDTEGTVGGHPAKINSAYTVKGIEGAINQVELLTGVHVSHYANLTFVAFTQLFDALGGVQASVPFEMSLKDIVNGGKITLSPGKQQLSGSEALVLARTRKAYYDYGEACRQMASREMVMNAISSVANDNENAEKYVDAFLAIADTDLDRERLLELVTLYSTHVDQMTFVLCTGPYEAREMPQYDGQVMVPRDERAWAKVIAAVESGGDPNAIVAPPVPEPMPKEEGEEAA